MKTIISAIALLGIAISLHAKEPEHILLGAGVGMGQSALHIEHSHFARHPILGTGSKQQDGSISGNGTLKGQPVMTPRSNTSTASWAIAWEFFFGYKHFVNDWAGFRYYGNVGIQHYKPIGTQSKNDPIGIIDYTLNMDLLIDFYESERWAFGIIGGVGFGGASFTNNAVSNYESTYNKNEGFPIGASDIRRHFFNLNANAGVRVVIFSKSAISGGIRICDSYATDKKRTCTSPANYTGHAFEVVAKFPMLEYAATKYDIMPNADTTKTDKFISRPAYKIKNPYRITFRYIVEF